MRVDATKAEGRIVRIRLLKDPMYNSGGDVVTLTVASLSRKSQLKFVARKIEMHQFPKMRFYDKSAT